MIRRRSLLAAPLLATLPTVARAQSWPTRPIRFVVPFAAGAGILARIALGPVDARIAGLISEVEAITDGRSLHRRIVTEGDARDEFGRLALTLNDMIARFEKPLPLPFSITEAVLGADEAATLAPAE